MAPNNDVTPVVPKWNANSRSWWYGQRKRTTTWKEFIRSHRAVLAGTDFRERPAEDEIAFLENHHRIPHDWISLLFFALFADNLVRWWEGAEGSYWFWLLSGQIEAVLIFAGLSVADLFLYWSRIGPTLDGSE